jgi:hypothetical protein
MSYRKYHNISSTTLFNFTDTFERLVGNIENGIYCGDIYEKLPSFGSPSGYIVPMVCFCDIPLGIIKEHLDWYGNYAIGIKREYARQYNVNPVWYIHKDNPVILKLFKSKNKKELANSSLLPFLKQFLGYQKDLEGNERLKKFYDEREWRFIPQDEIHHAKLIVNKPHIEGERLSQDRNLKRETRLKIELNRIEYIIIKKEDEKDKLYPILKKLSKHNSISYEKLVSSIITCNQIRKDF